MNDDTYVSYILFQWFSEVIKTTKLLSNDDVYFKLDVCIFSKVNKTTKIL